MNCYYCEEPKGCVSMRIDPYSAEVEDVVLEVFICDDCYQTRSDEI